MCQPSTEADITATFQLNFTDLLGRSVAGGVDAPYQDAVRQSLTAAYNEWTRHFDYTAGIYIIDAILTRGSSLADVRLVRGGLTAVGTYQGGKVLAPTFGLEFSARATPQANPFHNALFVNLDNLNYAATSAGLTSSIIAPLERELGNSLALQTVIGNTVYSPNLGRRTPYEGSVRFVQGPPNAVTVFDGPNARVAYGGPVPVANDDPGRTIAGGAQAVDTNVDGAATVQPLDMALLRDAGLPALTDQELLEHSIARLYFGAFGHVADSAGLVLQTAAVRSGAGGLGSVGNDLVASAEFSARYGTLSDTGFVSTVFQNVFGRAPGAADLTAALLALRTGASRGTLLNIYAQSDEARGRLSANANITYSGTAEAQVARMYDTAFGRDADPGGFVAYTRAIIDGTALQQVSLSFLGSAEFASRYGVAPSDAALVTGLYQNTLGRAPEAAGQALYVGALAAGLSRADLVVSFSESQEHINLVAARATARDAAGLYVDTAPHLGIIPVFGAG